MVKQYNSNTNKNNTNSNSTNAIIKNIWLCCNILFAILYTNYLISFFTLHWCVPNAVNCFLLAIAYSLVIVQHVRNGGKYTHNPNILSVLFFSSFPTYIYLLPYYFLSVYHLIVHYKKVIINSKTDIKNSKSNNIKTNTNNNVIHNIIVFLYGNKEFVGDMAIYSSFFIFTLAVVTLRITHVFFIGMIIRQQFHENEAMERVVLKIFAFLDQHMHRVPSAIEAFYKKIKTYSTNRKINKNIK
ncbi:hypothetical protein EHP00_2046 [Ecytonucleospora hepatopenaei]|uniref:Uncharacterized protein n=1 Tax=Ecytonucleospora hepatopenaei TaxID=646526 RepID=A0A1W0E4D5_9MICR|nr:hypothetical protein EHP00_2046 [Ecytonucleospora hepatopenaei]